MDLEPGTRIDKYEVLELLGSGAMASVFKVRHTQLDAIYALKLLDRASRRTRDRLLQEGRVQAALRHPNIVAVSDVVEHDGQPGLVMEYVPGLDMAAFIARRHPIDFATIDRLATATIKGVRAAHRAGQVHRDLKPANILLAKVDDDLVPKVADFGLVKALGTESSEGLTRTRTGAILGSPAFMSPEQTRASKHVDHRADLWALGTVLYQLVAGDLAFPAEDLVMLFSKVRVADHIPVQELRPDVPDRMRLAIEAALVAEPEARVQSCDELLAIWTGEALPRTNTSSTETISGSFLTPELDELTGPEPAPVERPELASAEVVPVLGSSEPTGTLVPELEPRRGRRPPSSVDTLVQDELPSTPASASSSAMWLLPWMLAGASLLGMVTVGGLALGLWLGRGAVSPSDGPTQGGPVERADGSAHEAAEPTDAPSPREAPTEATPASAPKEAAPATESGDGSTPQEAPKTPRQPEPSPVTTRQPAAPPSAVDGTRAGTDSSDDPSTASENPPVPAQSGTFTVTGGAEEAWLVRQGTYHSPGSVPPGTYTVAARFPGLPVQPIDGLVVTIQTNDHITLDCVAPFRTCRQK